MSDVGSLAEWRCRLARYSERGGMTRTEWCAREGVSLHQLKYWRGAIAEADGRASGAVPVGGELQGSAPGRIGSTALAASGAGCAPTAGDWLAVEVSDVSGRPGGALSATAGSGVAVHIGAARIDLAPGFDTDVLAAVIGVLRVQPC